MRLVEYDLDDLGQMTVPGETGRWYRYIDMTAQAEALYDFLGKVTCGSPGFSQSLESHRDRYFPQ